MNKIIQIFQKNPKYSTGEKKSDLPVSTGISAILKQGLEIFIKLVKSSRYIYLQKSLQVLEQVPAVPSKFVTRSSNTNIKFGICSSNTLEAMQCPFRIKMMR